jgi:DNA repair protein RecO (recombination protein O)
MKFIGHLDIMRYFQKAMRRADIDICYSEGFSPHQIMSFAAPLGVGITSDGEYLDIEVHESKSTKEALHWFSGKTARMLCDHCVNELRRKPENMAALPTYQKVQESTVYTMQYIMTAKLAKLYTFSVSDQVLWELQQCIREYMKYYINHSFKSLKILEEVENMI